MNYKLPVDYDVLTPKQRREVRLQYIEEQDGRCMYCNKPLDDAPHERVLDLPINWDLFPQGFLRWPVHLQHCHDTGMTEGAIHAYCNAVLWQYHGR